MPTYIIQAEKHFVGNYGLGPIQFVPELTEAYHFNKKYVAERHVTYIEKSFPGMKLTIEEIASQVPITWDNILNGAHVPVFGWNVTRLCTAAKDLGYTYMNWSGRIYEVNSLCETGVFCFPSF